MELKTPRDIGRQARACRRFRMLRQSEVAAAVGVSRQWIGDLEKGKPTLELGLVLRAFEELGLDLTATRTPTPPPWTVPLTLDAELREWRSINARRRRRMQARQREADIAAGNQADR
jgi:transcriptional regulator with XRE-family HTH domain